MFASLAKSKKASPAAGRFNVFQALCTSLAARGSGNLAGVALAIAPAGPAPSSGCGFPRCSAWPAALPNVLLRSSTKNAMPRAVSRRPGLVHGAGSRHALDGRLFSILLLLAYGIFNTVQANSVAHAMRYAFLCHGHRRRAGALILLVIVRVAAWRV
jgi:AGCS family alanine or glycine:cation symporter